MEVRRLIGLAIIVVSLTSLLSVVVVSYSGRGARITDLYYMNLEASPENGAALVVAETRSRLPLGSMELYKSSIYKLRLLVRIGPLPDKLVIGFSPQVTPPPPPHSLPGGPVVTPMQFKFFEARVDADVRISECLIGLYAVYNRANPMSLSVYAMDPERVANYIKTTADDVLQGDVKGGSCALARDLEDIDYDIGYVVVFLRVDPDSRVVLTPLGIPNVPPITVSGDQVVGLLLGEYLEIEGELPNGTKVYISMARRPYPLVSIVAVPELDAVAVARALSLTFIGLIVYAGGPARLVDAVEGIVERVMARRGRGGSG
ncbi:MAG: SRPBCC domain-containing protein [Desulfurococcales archaeon]|nr:SRPBCC domain-containing protein [Desulfurococcales archaeon]